jgi:hypothetical protein
MSEPFTGYVVDLRKLRDYCLSDTHPRGRHKARIFRSRLGLTSADAEFLRQALLDAVRIKPTQLRPAQADEYGNRYTLEFDVSTAVGSARIRSAWIVIRGQNVLQLTTCFVL